MARRKRICESGVVQHVMNRGNRQAQIFHDPEDYTAFLRVLASATRKYPIRLLAYCVMPNHWHLVVWPPAANAVSAYMQWLTSTHVQRYHRVHGLVGTGHLYQGRYRSVPVQTDRHLLTVLRYVEANPQRAGLVSRAEDWPWSGLAEQSRGGTPLTTASPVQRPKDWLALVNAPVDGVERVRRAALSGRPFGALDWTRETATRCNLPIALRGPGRPARDRSVDAVQL